MKAKLVHSVLLAVFLLPCTARATTYDSAEGVFAAPVPAFDGDAMAPWVIGETLPSFYVEEAPLDLPGDSSSQVNFASPGETAAEPSSALPLLAGLLVVGLWVFLKGRRHT